MTATPRKLPRSLEWQIIQAQLDGLPTKAVAKEFNVATGSVSRVMHRNGYVRRWVKADK